MSVREERILGWDEEKGFFKINREAIRRIIEEKFPFVLQDDFLPPFPSGLVLAYLIDVVEFWMWELLIEVFKGRMHLLKIEEIREDFIEQCNSYFPQKIVEKIDRTIRRMKNKEVERDGAISS
jgi:hypothetical protein